MRRSRTLPSGLLSIVLVATASFSQVQAAALVGGTDNWTFAGPPLAVRLGLISAARTTFANHLDVSALGIVVMVLRNSEGQTIYFSTATVNITRGMYGIAYTVEYGLPPGVYNATIFAISTNGVAISNSSTIPFQAR